GAAPRTVCPGRGCLAGPRLPRCPPEPPGAAGATRSAPALEEAPMTDLVLLEREGETAKVTLNQPAKLNAINNRMWTRLREIFTGLDAGGSLRCVILAGAGERAFSVGADIGEFEENRSTIEQARRYFERTHAAMEAIVRCRHPVVAQIRGLCVG